MNTISGTRLRPLSYRVRRAPPKTAPAVVSVPVAAAANTPQHLQSPSTMWPPLQSAARANALRHQRDLEGATRKSSEAKRHLLAHPPREQGLRSTTARRRAIVLAAIDLPAMIATAAALRIENPIYLLLLAGTATAINGMLGWEAGKSRRYEKDPELPKRYEIWNGRAFLMLCATWLTVLFFIRANASTAWSPFGLNSFLVAGFLTCIAATVMAICGRLAYEVESDRVAEARAEVERHEQAGTSAQRAYDIYATDLNAANTASAANAEEGRR